MNISERLFNMKKIIFAFFFLLSPFSTYGNTDNQLILSKNDTNKMFEMSMKEWVSNVKKLKEIGATFPCPDNKDFILCIDTGSALMSTIPNYSKGDDSPFSISVLIQYKIPNFLNKKKFEEIVKLSKKEMSPEYNVKGNWQTPPEQNYALISFDITKKKKELVTLKDFKTKIFNEYKNMSEFKLVQNRGDRFFHYVNPMAEPVTGYDFKRKQNDFFSHIIEYEYEKKFQIITSDCQEKTIAVSEPIEKVYRYVRWHEPMSELEEKVYCDTDYSFQREIWYCKSKKLREYDSEINYELVSKANNFCLNK